jgi:hypothetical protein
MHPTRRSSLTKRVVSLGLVTGLVAAGASTASAQADVYEGFDIAFQQLVGPAPGSSGFGWVGDWAVSLSLDALVGPEGRGASESWGPDQDGTPPDNIPFDGYTSGGHTTGRSVIRTDGAGTAVITRSLNTSALSAGLVEGGELWFGMLVGTPSQTNQIGMTLGVTGFDPETRVPTGDPTLDRGYGYHLRTQDGAMNLIARGWKGGGFIGAGEPSIPVGVDEDMLIIVRYQFVAGQDILTAYKVLESDAGKKLSELPQSAFLTAMEPSELVVMSLYQTGTPRMDEIRISALAPGGDVQACLDAVAPGMGLSVFGSVPDGGIYEPFDIAFGQAVDGAAGSSGFGWTGDWTTVLDPSATNGPEGRGAGESFGPDQDGIEPDNISFNGYTDSHTQGRSVKRLVAAGNSAIHRPIDPAALMGGLVEGGEVWASMLIVNTGFNNDYGFGLGATAFDPATKKPLGVVDDKTFGFQMRSVSGVMEIIARGWKGGGFQGASPDSIPVALNEKMLVVLRYQFFPGEDALTVWKVSETDSGAFLTDLPAATWNSNIFMDPSLFTLVAQYETANCTYDEFRFASVPFGADPEDALDEVAPGMDLDIAPLPPLTFNADSADLYEPFDMPESVVVDKQGSGKGWGEDDMGNTTGASRWDTLKSGGEHEVLPAAQSLGASVPLFGSPELVFNGVSARRIDGSQAGSVTRMIDPALAQMLFQEGGETWVAVALDLNDRSGASPLPVSGNNTQVVFANAPAGPEGFANLPEGTPGVYGEFTGFGFRVTGDDEGVDTIIRPTAFFDGEDGWKESSDVFPPLDATSTDWFSGDKIFVIMRCQWKRTMDGPPIDENPMDGIPDDGTTDVITVWRLVPEFSVGGFDTDLDTFPNQELIQGSAFFDADPLNPNPVGEVAIRNHQINQVTIAQNLTGAVDELRASYVRFGETSQDALSRVAPGLSLTVSNTANPPMPPCNEFDLNANGMLDGNDVEIYLADPYDLNMDGVVDFFDIAIFQNGVSTPDPNCN